LKALPIATVTKLRRYQKYFPEGSGRNLLDG
jgi:hypothetical protein